jgi:hypothetical protein
MTIFNVFAYSVFQKYVPKKDRSVGLVWLQREVFPHALLAIFGKRFFRNTLKMVIDIWATRW